MTNSVLDENMHQTINGIPFVKKSYQHALICLLLAAASLIVYWKVGGFDFIIFDDNLYVFQNRQVMKGLTPDSILWAFNLSKDAANPAYWHPLTWMSHMIDCQVFGLDAGKHHLVNLTIHIMNALLLYLVFHQMTGAVWKSAFVAALFAVHPLNVDSVAWIAERKNLLSTSFWFLTMMAYVRYAKRPSLYRYLPVFAAMATGLLAKPMLVTLPCVLLLMDFWPMGRVQPAFTGQGTAVPGPFHPASPARLIAEKVPLLVLSFISIILSVISLQHHNQIISQHTAPLSLRVENAIVSYIQYIGKIAWPRNMTIYYPFPDAIPFWQVAGALILLAAAFATVFFLLKKAPYLAVGWLWFIGTLLPVIGIIQGGRWPAVADRWTYVPAIGIFMIISWGGASLFRKLSEKTAVRAIAAIAAIAVLMLVSHNQLKHWKNSITLFSHALNVTKNNDVAHYNLGVALGEKGDMDQAIHHYYEGLKINPNMAEGHNNLANALIKKGMLDQAIAHFRHALELNPELVQAHSNLGNALIEKGLIDPAIEHFSQALKLDPEQAEAHINLGKALARKGEFEPAIRQFHQAMTLDPESAIAQNNLGNALAEKGDLDKAIDAFHQALKIDPDYAEVHNNLGNALARKGRLDEALYHYETIITEDRKDTITVKNRNALLSFLKPADQVNILFKTAVRFTGEKKYDRAIALFQRILTTRPDNPIIYYNISCLYALQNLKEPAIEWLEQAVDHGYDNWAKLKTDPDMNNIKDEPGYRRLLEKGEKKQK